MNQSLELNTKRISVTGGTGLVGSHLTACLLLSGCTPQLLVRRDSKHDLLRSTLTRMGADHLYNNITFTETALNNPQTLCEALTTTDILFHCAATVSFDSDKANEIISTNTEITTQLVDASIVCGIELLVHISSIATLGTTGANGLIDETSVFDGIQGKSAYSVSKFYCESVVRRAQVRGLQTVILNPGIVIGEGDWKGSSAQLIRVGLRQRLFYTDGVKGYTDVRDVARAACTLALRPTCWGQRFIISAANLSFGELFTLIRKAAGRHAPCIRIGRRTIYAAVVLCRLWGRLTHTSSQLTSEIASNAIDRSFYDGHRITEATTFTYTPIQETIDRVTKAYLQTDKKTP